MRTVEDYIIDFNRDLEVIEQETFCMDELIDNSDYFKVIASLNLNEDDLVIRIVLKRVFRISMDCRKVEYQAADEPSLILNESGYQLINNEDHVIIQTHFNIKDLLLELFSCKKRTFVVTISYNDNSKTIFTLALPTIGNQQHWSNKKDYVRSENGDNDTEDDVPIDENEGVKHKALNDYFPFDCNPALVQLFQSDFKTRGMRNEDARQIKKEFNVYRAANMNIKFKVLDYLEFFRRMLIIEDLNIQRTVSFHYSMSNQLIRRYIHLDQSFKNVFLKLLQTRLCDQKASEMLENAYIIEAQTIPDDIENYGEIFITDMEDFRSCSYNLIKQLSYSATIDYIFGKYIIFNAKNVKISTNANIPLHRNYHIEFSPNRMTIRTAQRAIDMIEEHNLSKYFSTFDLPVCTNSKVRDSELKFNEFTWINEVVSNNDEQKQAIKNIVNETAFPSPYILFGPPGTGKTTTIIEAIVQIIKLKPNARILLTSNTNSNCDNLGTRLLDFVSCNKVLRIYSTRYDEHSEKIPPQLKRISNYRLETLCKCESLFCKEKHPYDNPSYEEFYTARVVIATLCSSGRFVTGGIRSDHFDYIFIDEAATNAEQYTLIPISGLGSNFNQITANIVLCGDPKQLGPIIADPFNISLGMKHTMMQRMLMMNKYRRSKISIFVTQLVRNFRNNHHILQFSNKQFYNLRLKAEAPSEIADFAVGWNVLPNPQVPILFHANFSPCYKVGTSLINDGEIAVVNYYVDMLLANGINMKRVYQEDIGIISTYRAQRENMVLLFKTCFPNVEIGTIDSFQGREKKIIILSTVRSETNDVGFLSSAKRLNVALTRAQSLLIITGNTNTLSKNRLWWNFIHLCSSLHTLVKEPYKIRVNKVTSLFGDIKEPLRPHGGR